MSSPWFLLHGWGMHGGVWGEFAQCLPQPVFTPDLPGFGGRPWSGAESAEQALDCWADSLLAELPPRCRILAWSLGGMVALRLVQRLGEQALSRIESLDLLACNPCFAQRPDWPTAMAPDTLAAFRQSVAADPVAGLQRFIALMCQGDPDARAQVRSLRQALAERPAADAQALNLGLAVLAELDLRPALDQLPEQLPLRWILAENDSLVPVSMASSPPCLSPSAQVDIQAARGHALFLSQPQSLADLLEGRP